MRSQGFGQEAFPWDGFEIMFCDSLVQNPVEQLAQEGGDRKGF